MHNKKVLVTGATGLLGSNVAYWLLENGFNVCCLIRKNSNAIALQNIPCEFIIGDITNVYDIDKALNDCSFVIHCAAYTQQSGNFNMFIKTNLYATAILIEACKKHAIKKFIYVSTANCFSNGTLSNPGNEQGEFMPWLKRSNYAYSKYMAQQLVLHECKENQFPALVVVPSFILGARDARVSSGKLLLNGLKKYLIFYPAGGKSFVDVDHAAQAIVNALSIGKNGESYLLAGENLSYQDFFKKVKNLTHSKAILIRIPRWILGSLSLLGDIIQFLMPFRLAFNSTNIRLLTLENYFSNKKATQQLKMKRTNTDEAIQKALTWYKQNGYLA